MSFERTYDFCICIETTNNMAPFIENVKMTLRRFAQMFRDACEEEAIKVKQVRVKFIEFKDFGCCTDPIKESEFILATNPEEQLAICNYLDGIKCTGGYGFCNALEAIALAMNSKWNIEDGNGMNRHTIVVFTNGKVHPLQLKRNVSSYPKDMPKDIDQLALRWEYEDLAFAGYLGRKWSKRLIVFAPETEPWTRFMEWNRFWPEFNGEKRALSDMDIDTSLISAIFMDDVLN